MYLTKKGIWQTQKTINITSTRKMEPVCSNKSNWQQLTEISSFRNGFSEYYAY